MSAIYLIKLARKLRKEIVRQNPDYILPFLWTTCVRTDFALMGLSLKERVIQTVETIPQFSPKQCNEEIPKQAGTKIKIDNCAK